MEHIRNSHPLHQLIFAESAREIKMDDKNTPDKVYTFRKGRGSQRMYTTKSPACSSNGERQCEDGTCIARVELCPEEQLMNQNTILIMIVVGLAVVVFLVILYCFQQRQRRASQALGTDTGLSDDCDNASLYAPPPSYEDVMSSNLYLPTAEHRRMLSSADEPLTPPPNYDTALILLAQSQDSALNKPRRSSSTFRRSVSMENVNGEDSQQNRCSVTTRNSSGCRNSKKENKKKNIFRYSGRFTRTSVTSDSNPSSPPPQGYQRTLPPYSPPIYPVTPPPPISPTPISVHTQFILPETDQTTVIQTTVPLSANERDVI